MHAFIPTLLVLLLCAAPLRADLKSPDAKQRRNAVAMLASQPGDMQPALFEAIEDPDEAVRAQAIQTMGIRAYIQSTQKGAAATIQDKESVWPKIETHLEKESSGKVRIAAVTAIGLAKAPGARPLLEKSLRDKDPEVGVATFAALLAYVGKNSKDIQDVAILGSKAPTPSVRLGAAKVLSTLKTPEAKAAFDSLKSDSDPSVKQAVSRLSQAKSFK